MSSSSADRPIEDRRIRCDTPDSPAVHHKKNISNVENALDKVCELNGINFEWKTNGQKSIGVLAQDVEKILPELVDNSDEYKAVNYNGLIGVLIEAVKELRNEVNELKNK